MPSDAGVDGVEKLERWCGELLNLEESYFLSDKEAKKKELSDKIEANIDTVPMGEAQVQSW